jgi:hypothetical protein
VLDENQIVLRHTKNHMDDSEVGNSTPSRKKKFVGDWGHIRGVGPTPAEGLRQTVHFYQEKKLYKARAFSFGIVE